MKFTVGLKQKRKVNHVVMDAEDALIDWRGRLPMEHPRFALTSLRWSAPDLLRNGRAPPDPRSPLPYEPY